MQDKFEKYFTKIKIVFFQWTIYIYICILLGLTNVLQQNTPKQILKIFYNKTIKASLIKEKKMNILLTQKKKENEYIDS